MVTYQGFFYSQKEGINNIYQMVPSKRGLKKSNKKSMMKNKIVQLSSNILENPLPIIKPPFVNFAICDYFT